jgi:predicted nucleic acid-binding protein
VTGTLGVLAKAKSIGLIPSFHEAAQAMRRQGIHYNAGLITRIAQHLGEIAK